MTKRQGVVDALTEYHDSRGHDPLDRILWRCSIITKVLIALATIMAIATGEFFLILSGVLALAFMLAPAMVERTWRVYLPVEIDAFVTAFIFIHFALGELNQYYDRMPWFDFALHWTSGFVLALLGFLIIFTFLSTNRVQARPVFIFLFTISLAMGMGALWEIFEFAMDQSFGFNMQKTGLIDTMWDLIATFIGAILISFFGFRYVKARQQRKGFIHRLVKKSLQRRQNTH